MSAHVLLVDNYDSFTYNLVQVLRVLNADVSVLRNDQVDSAVLGEDAPAALRGVTHLLVSPGPGRPEHAGASVDMVRAAMPLMPVLGVCLGHQAIGVAMGLEVGPAARLMHGKTSRVFHDDATVYRGLPNPFPAGRYHSLAVAGPQPDDDVTVSAYTVDGEVMGLRHRSLPTEGIQFHPESVLTPDGELLMANFLGLESPGRTKSPAATAENNGGEE